MLRVTLSQRNRSRGIMTWYARIFDTDARTVRYESLGTTRKTEAREEMQSRLAEGAFRKPGKGETTLGDALDAYILHLERKGCADSSVQTALCAFRTVESVRGERLEGLDRKRLQDAFFEATRNLRPSSRNLFRRIVGTAVRLAIRELDLEIRNPVEAIPVSKSLRKERDFWTPEQVDRILDRAPSRKHRLLWAFMAFCGLRVHEARKAKPEDVRDGFLHVVGKGGKYAKVPLCARMLEEIRRAGGTWDFAGTGTQAHVVAKAARAAIPEGFRGKATNHRFRHSFASNLIRAGVNVKAVSRLMRHSNANITLAVYSHVLDEDLSGELEKMFSRT